MAKPRMKTAYVLDMKEYEEGGYVVDIYFDKSEILRLATAILNVVNEGHEKFAMHVHRSGVKNYPNGSVFVEGK